MMAGQRARAVEYAFLLCVFACCAGLFLDCSECRREQCPEPKCDKRLAHYDQCGCCLECRREGGQSCGGRDGAGGQCATGLYCAYRTGSVLGDDRLGKCEPGGSECKSRVCGYRQSCTAGGVCACPQYRCRGRANPVCGNNGRQYQSMCELQRDECLNNTFIGISSLGACSRVQEVQAGFSNEQALLSNQLNGLHPYPEEPTAFCVFKNSVYLSGEVIEADPCHYLQCLLGGATRLTSVPGCQGTEAEVDYGVEELPVDGQWASWGLWSQCSSTDCGNGTRTRHRLCDPGPLHEGRQCVGNSMQLAACISPECQAELGCEYAAWSNWSSCSARCGWGTSVRTRALLASGRGPRDQCSLALSEETLCNIKTCSGRCRAHRASAFVTSGDCRSTRQFKVKYCEGACSEGSGWCCGPSSYTTVSLPFQCPGQHYHRDVPVELVDECSCQPCAS